MKNVVVDCSVIVPWAFAEENRDRALVLRNASRQGDVQLFAPRLLAIEFANVAWKKVQRKMCGAPQARKALEWLAFLPIAYHSHSGVRMQAFDLACRQKCTFYDALYLALAEKTGSAIATFDGQMRKNAEHCKIKIYPV